MALLQHVGSARPMLSDALIVAAGNVAVKGAGLLKLIVAAHLFGTSDAQDAYLAAFLLPAVLGDIFAATAAPSLIPAMLRLRAAGLEREAADLSREALFASVTLMFVLAALLALASPLIFVLLASGFDPAKTALARTLLYMLLPLLPLAGCNVIWRAILHTHRRFALAAVAPAITPFITLAILLAGAPHWGIYALAIGTITGGFAETTLLAFAVQRLNYSIRPAWITGGPRMAEVLVQFAPLLASSLLLGGSPLIDNAMAAGLEAGSVSVFNFGSKLATVISTIGPAAVGTAALPHLSGMAARGEWQTMRRNLMSFATLIIAAAIPLTALLIAFSEPLVRLVFEKGAFTASSTHAVAVVQSYSLLQAPFAVLIALGFRLTASLRANNLLPPVAAVGLGVTAAGDFLLRQVLGVAGIALTATFSQIAMILTLAVLLARRIRRGGGPR